MYQLHNTGNGYLLTQNGTAALHLPDGIALAELRTVIDNALAQLPPPAIPDALKPIGTAQARKIAQTQGLTVPPTTLVSACEGGAIVGAQKMGGRWKMPEAAFRAWLDRWSTRGL